MLILGIDPGLSALGWGLVRSEKGRSVYVDSGTIVTKPKDPYPARLSQLHHRVGAVIEEHRPQVLAMERPIYAQNVKTAITLGQAGGMALLAGAEHGLFVHEFTPLEIKKAIVGKGRASKEQVQKMIAVILGLSELPPSEHAADALAAAVCYAHSEKMLRLMGKL